MMDKQQQIKKLTLKYFIDQKITEVFWFIFIGTLIIFTPYYVGYWVMEKLVLDELELEEHMLFFDWFTGFLLVIIIGYLIYWGFQLISEWLGENWEKAELRAKKEVKGK